MKIRYYDLLFLFAAEERCAQIWRNMDQNGNTWVYNTAPHSEKLSLNCLLRDSLSEAYNDKSVSVIFRLRNTPYTKCARPWNWIENSRIYEIQGASKIDAQI